MSERYDRIYRQDDYFGPRESHLLQRYAYLLPAGSRILDIGVGQGRNALPLARTGCRVVGLDTSRRAVELVNERARRDELLLEAVQVDVFDFDPATPFDAVLCFGLLQMLDPADGASLVNRLHRWVRPAGALFISAWHVDDPRFAAYCDKAERLGLRSFRTTDGDYRMFLQRNEILDLFMGWTVVHHWEGLGPEHRHGDGPVEQHGEVEAVFLLPSTLKSTQGPPDVLQ